MAVLNVTKANFSHDQRESIREPFDTFTILSQHTTEEPIVMGFSTKESTHDSCWVNNKKRIKKNLFPL